MDKSESLCKTGSEVVLRFFEKYSGTKKDSMSPDVSVVEKYSDAVGVLEKLFENSQQDAFRFDDPHENGFAGGAAVRSSGGSMASFSVEENGSMEMLRGFAKNLDAFYLAAVVDKKDPSKVSLMFDWKVDNVENG